MNRNPTTPPLPFRQVHLDFHTHGDVPGVGEKFDKGKFQEALKRGHVNSVTLFSKCHHGWSYHDTKIGRKHPHLSGELLPRQIEACREIGVRCPIYLSAGYDELAAVEHPEWIVKERYGENPPLEKAGFRVLRFNSPYLDYLCRQIEEVAQRWPDGDGLFLDIVFPRFDFSEGALREMRELGLDPAKEEDVRAYSLRVYETYHERATAAARSTNSQMGIFHNSGHISVGCYRFLEYNSHLELESLPTGGWGYDHFPLSAAYAQTTGFEFLGMTGKFHTTWGEFGGFKRPAALRYECAATVAAGARCSIGDQLHPSGEMNRDTYNLIGSAYAEIERKEPWCGGARPVVQIGILSSLRDQHIPRGHSENEYADEGAARVLLEGHHPFLLLDRRASWDPFDLVILPDSILVDDAILEKANAHLAAGRKILASGESLIDPARNLFAIDPGATLRGRCDFDPTYLVATSACPEIAVRSPIVIHGKAWDIEPVTAEVFAGRALPYFNRSPQRFFGHQHAPEATRSKSPAAVIGGQIAYFAHEIFTRYRLYGQPLYRDFILAAIDRLLGARPLVRTNLPSTGRVSLMDQSQESRYVLHLLHATPVLRGNPDGPMAKSLQIIEDLIPIHEVACRLNLPRPIERARLVPQNVPLALHRNGDEIAFTIEKMEGHQMVELVYRSER